MKPLVYYCRWQKAALRLRGRDQDAVWGQLVFNTSAGEEDAHEFRFLLASAELFVQEEEGEGHYWLDEMGVPLPQSE